MSLLAVYIYIYPLQIQGDYEGCSLDPNIWGRKLFNVETILNAMAGQRRSKLKRNMYVYIDITIVPVIVVDSDRYRYSTATKRVK